MSNSRTSDKLTNGEAAGFWPNRPTACDWLRDPYPVLCPDRLTHAVSHNIYIVEDHAVMCDMTRVFLGRHPDLVVCGAAATAEAALADPASDRADVLLVDLALPRMNGIELMEAMLARRPELPCIIFSGHDDHSCVDRALAAGARGYVLKGNANELLVAVRQVLDGDIYLSDRLEYVAQDT